MPPLEVRPQCCEGELVVHAGGSERTSENPGEADGSGLPPSDFVRAYQASGATVLELHGEIDLVALLELQPYVDEATAGPSPGLVIDLRHVTFLDCSGLRLLVRARVRVSAVEGRLRLVCDNPGMLRILRAGGLIATLRPLPTLEEALSDAPSADQPHEPGALGEPSA